MSHFDIVKTLSPLFYYPMNEISGTTAIDHSGNCRDANYLYKADAKAVSAGEPRLPVSTNVGQVVAKDMNGRTPLVVKWAIPALILNSDFSIELTIHNINFVTGVSGWSVPPILTMRNPEQH